MKMLLLFSALLFTTSTRGLSEQVLPTGALAVPVLITLGNGETASGFYLNCSNHLFLGTARHVLFDQNRKLKSAEAKLLSMAYVPGEDDLQMTVNLGILEASKQVRAHPVHDVAIVRLGRKDAATGFDFDTRVIKVVSRPKSVFAVNDLNMMRRLATVTVGEEVIVFGYPTSIGLQQSPKFDYSKPLLRKGMVSGIYKGAQTIILDSSVYFGNSGGPVMEVTRTPALTDFKIIGIVSEIIPFVDVWENKRFNYTTANLSNSGYSIVEPVDFLLELTWD